ncbi:hypothetical protein J5X91_12205, partial [Pseudoalteromonas sp. K222D]|nr:hypothetical protein [Pseudoalteromonas sp. K222D]
MHPLLEQEELDFIFELYRPTTSTKPASEQSQNRNCELPIDATPCRSMGFYSLDLETRLLL